jgi:ATP-dependent helicase/nuclease subunit A
MGDWTWTDSQRQAIDARGASVLVSAGAGSGKTAVLAERCAHLAAAADPPCPVDRMLVVTFTDAAATEMRQRIAQAIRERLKATPTNVWLQRQLALLDTAWISTIHSFCRRVLNRYFAQVDLDPLAPVLEPNEAELLRRETARRVFDELADREDSTGEAFLDLLAHYGGSSEEQLIGRVLGLDAFLSSVPDPHAWMDACRQRFEVRSTDKLPDFWLERLREALAAEIERQRTVATGHLAGLARMPGVVASAVDSLKAHSAALDDWLAIVKQGADGSVIDRLCREAIAAHEPPKPARRDSRVLGKLSEQERQAFLAAVDAVGEVRDVFNKRLKDAYGRFLTADWAEGIARTGPHVATFLDLARSIRKAYQAAKHELGVVDFGDLERFTLDLLRDDGAGAAEQLRDRFHHVLVDEFQDVNPIQAEILRLVSREGRDPRAGNLFAVGDVKQCIYRFRLAEPRLFLERRDSFGAADDDRSPRPWPRGSPDNESPPTPASVEMPPPGQGQQLLPRSGIVIDLVENFRSRPAVINAINAVFERLMSRDLGGVDYDEHARLKAGKTEDALCPGPTVELHVLDKLAGAASGDESEAEDDGGGQSEAFDWEQIEREAYVVAERIKALVAQGTPYRDIVVLLRTFQPHAALFVRTLARLDVPVFAEVSGGFFEALEVQDVLSLLMLLDNQQQDIPLVAVLRSPILGRALMDSQVAEIAVAGRRASAGMPFHAAVRRYARDGADAESRAHLAGILDRLARWRRRIRRRPLADVLWEIYEETGYFAYVAGLREGPQRQANLLQLHEYARGFEGFKRQGLYRFLRFIDGLRESGQDLEPGSVASPSGDVVRVMTIHRSKGLEFPVVVLADLGKQFNHRDARGSILFDRRLGMAMEAVDLDRRIRYPTLPHRLVADAVWSESLAEEMRILYVALTRAKQRLVLVGTGRAAALSRDRERYAGQTDPLPLLDRLTASSMLDWLRGAICRQPEKAVAFGWDAARDAASSQSRAAFCAGDQDGAAFCEGGGLFAIRTYVLEEMSQWSIDPPERAGVVTALRRCAAAEPLEVTAERPDAETGRILEQVKRRLTEPYPAAVLTGVPAVMAASALKSRWDTRQDEDDPIHPWRAESTPPAVMRPLRHRFREPSFLGSSPSEDPTFRGTCTHAFLQHIDLHRPCDQADLHDQMQVMIQSGRLSAEEAAAVDFSGAAWFLDTGLGRRLRAPATSTFREWPFVLSVDPRRFDPAAVPRNPEDATLVRGIIDCLFDSGGEWEVLDYKTDRLSSEDLPARVEFYRGQLDIYAAAVEAAWQHRVVRRWLAFLSMRQVIEA